MEIKKKLAVAALSLAFITPAIVTAGPNAESSGQKYLYNHQMVTALYTSNRNIGWRGGDDLSGLHVSAKASVDFFGLDDKFGGYSQHFYFHGGLEYISDSSANQEPQHFGLRGGIGGHYPLWHSDDNVFESDIYVDLGLMYHDDETVLREDSGLGLYYAWGVTFAISSFPELQMAYGFETYPGRLYSTSFARIDYDLESILEAPMGVTLRAGTQNLDIGINYRF